MKFFEYENLMDELYSEIAKQIAKEIDQELIETLSKSINEIIAVQPMTQIITDVAMPFYLNYVYGTTKVQADTIDMSKFPHLCPRCKSPAYIGFASIECSKKGCE